MNELRRTLKAALATREETVLATVVRTSGTAYRRPGARMLFSRDRWVCGMVSGGCIESDLRERAWEQTEGGPALLVFDTRSDADVLWGYGMGCPGVVEVLAERLRPDAGWGDLVRCLDRRQPIRIATSLHESSLGARAWRSGGATHGDAQLLDASEDVFIEDVAPGPRLIIVGAGNDALPLERMAREVGWMTCVADHRAGFADEERFPQADERFTAPVEDLPAMLGLDGQSFVVVMTHGYLADLALLPRLLGSASPYVGLVSSRRRADQLLTELAMDRPSKFHSPVGLRLGAEGPEEIALSVLAEMQGVLAGCAGSG